MPEAEGPEADDLSLHLAGRSTKDLWSIQNPSPSIRLSALARNVRPLDVFPGNLMGVEHVVALEHYLIFSDRLLSFPERIQSLARMQVPQRDQRWVCFLPFDHFAVALDRARVVALGHHSLAPLVVHHIGRRLRYATILEEVAICLIALGGAIDAKEHSRALDP